MGRLHQGCAPLIPASALPHGCRRGAPSASATPTLPRLVASQRGQCCCREPAALRAASLTVLAAALPWASSLPCPACAVPAGAVSSAFFAGYMVTNLCGGFLATRYSAKGVLALGVVLWSMFTIATPTAAAGNLNELLLAR